MPADSQVTATVFCNEADAALKAFSHWGTAPVWITGQAANDQLAEQDLFVMPGIYAVCNGQAQVFVRNFGEFDRVIAEATLLTYGSATEPMSAVSALSHAKPETLTPAKVTERKDFLKKSLKLDASSILRTNPQLQTKLLQLLMENFDAISQTMTLARPTWSGSGST